MNSRERNQWNRAFAACWNALQRDGRLPLHNELARAARKLRDEGKNPESVARGLYYGTRDAMRRDGVL